jgi:uncharacterized protein YdhG (YjbR/CyaY superfamily)
MTMTDAKATARNGSGRSRNVWTDEERAAMQASARERKSTSKRSPAEDRAEGLQALQDSIAKMPGDDRGMAERIHTVVMAAVPSLVPKTYYGMPAYARDDGKVIAFFKPKSKFKVRYSTFGFQPDARLDDGDMWPTEFAVINLTSSVEARLVELIVRAAG